ncbi:MAG: hypothetical protein RBS38_08530, partial [Bacteroidales bacterium]|nr:hypothetical protein [Bacteroidales bacterium]
MKKVIFLVVALSLTIIQGFSQEKPFLSDIWSYLENPAVFELNQVEGHVPLVPYMNIDQSLS